MTCWTNCDLFSWSNMIHFGRITSKDGIRQTLLSAKIIIFKISIIIRPEFTNSALLPQTNLFFWRGRNIFGSKFNFYIYKQDFKNSSPEAKIQFETSSIGWSRSRGFAMLALPPYPIKVTRLNKLPVLMLLTNVALNSCDCCPSLADLLIAQKHQCKQRLGDAVADGDSMKERVSVLNFFTLAICGRILKYLARCTYDDSWWSYKLQTLIFKLNYLHLTIFSPRLYLLFSPFIDWFADFKCELLVLFRLTFLCERPSVRLFVFFSRRPQVQ